MNSAWTEYGLMRKPAQEDELVNKQIEESDSEDADKNPDRKKAKTKNYGGGHITEVLLLRSKPMLGLSEPVSGMYLLWDLRHGFRREEYCVCCS